MSRDDGTAEQLAEVDRLRAELHAARERIACLEASAERFHGELSWALGRGTYWQDKYDELRNRVLGGGEQRG